MQDRYAGDIGDFAKFAILRALVQRTGLRVGLVWYLTSRPGDPAGDGRHKEYLMRNERNERRFRACDPELFDRMKEIAESDHRNVAAYPAANVLPKETVYVDRPLTYDIGAPRRERPSARADWLRYALDATDGCDVVMFDPDNGLPVKSARMYSSKGTKYVFLEEIAPYVSRGQTIVVYQHASRSGTLATQVDERLGQLRKELPLSADPFAIVWRPVSSRAFLIAPAARHLGAIRKATEALLAGPLSQQGHIYVHRGRQPLVTDGLPVSIR